MLRLVLMGILIKTERQRHRFGSWCCKLTNHISLLSFYIPLCWLCISVYHLLSLCGHFVYPCCYFCLFVVFMHLSGNFACFCVSLLSFCASLRWFSCLYHCSVLHCGHFEEFSTWALWYRRSLIMCLNDVFLLICSNVMLFWHSRHFDWS